jgi:hypothetical protein
VIRIRHNADAARIVSAELFDQKEHHNLILLRFHFFFLVTGVIDVLVTGLNHSALAIQVAKTLKVFCLSISVAS